MLRGVQHIFENALEAPLYDYLVHCSALSIRLFRIGLPLLHQHLIADDFPHDFFLGAKQLEERGVQVVEAVQQHFRHKPLLQPMTIRV